MRGGVTSDLGLLRSRERDLRRSRLRDRSLPAAIAGAGCRLLLLLQALGVRRAALGPGARALSVCLQTQQAQSSGSPHPHFNTQP